MPVSTAWPDRLAAARSRVREAWASGDGTIAHVSKRALLALVLLLAIPLAECAQAPPWTLDRPPAARGIDFLDASGEPFAHRGPRAPEKIDAAKLPEHVREAFIAIEDRRFYQHGAVDWRGLARASWHNFRAGGVVEGGSTITQQFVKNAYLTNDRVLSRKVKELFLADWAETWMTKDEILSRYLEQAYFGDRQTGLAAAADHYFGVAPADLSLGQAAMLAGLVKAPSRLSPSNDRKAARARMRTVLDAMVSAGFVTREEADAVKNPVARTSGDGDEDETGGWYADWVRAALPDDATGQVRTAFDPVMQKAADRAVAAARLGSAEVALVALRPDGRVVAMVGGKDWQAGGFNRATQAERQPGSTFKLFDYLAAFRVGARPSNLVLDAPVSIGDWQPTNAYSGYKGPLTLREAFAESSNTAAIRVAAAAGYDKVIAAARDLGVTAELPRAPSLPLGTATMPLVQLAGAYAAFAGGRYPVGLTSDAKAHKAPPHALDPASEWGPMLDVLWQAANEGTGHRAALAQATFGKTGTSQDGRDSLFVGFAGDLVCAVWVGRDDNKPVPGNSGGHLPAEIWRAFMSSVPLGRMSLPDFAGDEGAGHPWGAALAQEDSLAAQPGADEAAATASPAPRRSGSHRRARRHRGHRHGHGHGHW